MKNPLRWSALSAGIVLAFLSVTAAEYTVVDLGPGVARGINNSGKVAGYDTSGGFTYDPVQGRQATPPLTVYFPDDPTQPPEYGPYFSLIQVQWLGINDNGLLVGSGVMSNRFQPVPPFVDLSPYPLIWSGSGDPVLLKSQQGVRAVAANSGGIVVGGVFRYTTTTQELIGTGLYSNTDINEAGVIAGSALDPASGGARPATWNNGVVQILSVVDTGGFGSRYTMSATAINAAGQLAGNIGYGDFSGSYSRGFLWSPTKTNLIDAPVGELYGNEVTVHDLSDGGVVVGRWKNAQESRAFVYRNETFVDLNTLIPTGGWKLTAAYSINETGQIVGEGLLNGTPRAFLLNPSSPEEQPPSILLQPVGGRFGLGESTTLTTAANGTPPLSFQWQHEGTNLVGETGQSLLLSTMDAGDNGSYRVIVKNAFGEAFSDEAVVTVLDPEIGVMLFTGITVTGAVGGVYQIDATPSLTQPTWTPLTQLTLTNSPQVWIDMESGTNTAPRYYRSVRVAQ